MNWKIVITTILFVAVIFLAAEELTSSTQVYQGKLLKIGEMWAFQVESNMYQLELAPEEFLQENKIILTPNDEMQIDGFIDDGKLTVYRIIKEDSEIIFRDDKGTPLWESEKKKQHFVVDPIKCIGCRLCVKQCPVNAIEFKQGKAIIDADKCINCGICKNGNGQNFKGCPVGAIEQTE